VISQPPVSRARTPAGRIDELQAEVKVANEKAQALALKVIEGSSAVTMLGRAAEASTSAKTRGET
jgi:hypothetical protein